MQFNVLGVVEQTGEGITTVLSPTKPVIVLTTLLLNPNTYVSADHLYENLWDGHPPNSARATLQTYVMRLRRQIGRTVGEGGRRALIHTHPSGYQIEIATEMLDLLRFHRLIDQAGRNVRDPAGEVRCLRDALRLWRGNLLANVPSEALHRDEVPRLTQQWLETAERTYDIELELGNHRAVIPELRQLVDAHPQRERCWEQLVTALYQAGRQAEALDEYHRIKELLVKDLGIEPGPDLQKLELAILRGDELPVRIAEGPVVLARTERTGSDQSLCQLPCAVNGFVGREEETGDLSRVLTEGDESTGPPVALLRGLPGVGKTALALTVAHALRPYFPDGQWYVEMTDGAGAARPLADVQAEVLRTAGLGASEIPSSVKDRASALRAALTDRRVLLLLDGAQQADHVEQLLPGTAGSAVLVTSRNSLVELTALHGARSSVLDVLDSGESVKLLTHALGSRRIEAEERAAEQLALLCDGLPLAMRIAAAKLADRPNRSLEDFVAWLRPDSLARLTVGQDPVVSVLSAFDVSYESLGRGARRLLRSFGRPATHADFRDFSLSDAARLTGGSPSDIMPALDELLDASLLRSPEPGHFSLPRLLMLFARHKASVGLVRPAG